MKVTTFTVFIDKVRDGSKRQTGAQIMTVDGDLARRLIAVSKKIQEAHWSRDEADKLDQPEA